MNIYVLDCQALKTKVPQFVSYADGPANRMYNIHLCKVTVLVCPNLHVLIRLRLNEKSLFIRGANYP